MDCVESEAAVYADHPIVPDCWRVRSFEAQQALRLLPFPLQPLASRLFQPPFGERRPFDCGLSTGNERTPGLDIVAVMLAADLLQ